jgi:NAD-dependent dihydropyrimidine dehydrogenase PreA subunit
MDDASVPIIDSEACTTCGLCVARCPEGVVALRAGKLVLALPEACTYCGLCEAICPVAAIALPFQIVWGESAANA